MLTEHEVHDTLCVAQDTALAVSSALEAVLSPGAPEAQQRAARAHLQRAGRLAYQLADRCVLLAHAATVPPTTAGDGDGAPPPGESQPIRSEDQAGQPNAHPAAHDVPADVPTSRR
jgi:hypothetical protein